MRKPQTVKSTIKNDPFAAVIPFANEPDLVESPDPAQPEPAPVTNKPERTAVVANTNHDKLVAKEERAAKQKLTVHLAADLAERVKNAAYWNPKLTIASIAEQGIKYAIEKHEREHGGKYPPRDGELVGGRPIK